MSDNKLRQFVAQIEAANAEAREIAEHIGAIYKAAKDEGYDVAILREVIRRRAKHPAEVSEHDTVLELYENALRQQ